MAEEKSHVRPALLEDILFQSDALRAVSDHQFGPGSAALHRAAALVSSADRVILSGMGASLFAAIPLHYLLSLRGIYSQIVEASELLYFGTASLTRATTVVLISRSGESVEVTKLLPRLKQRNCRIIGIVNVPHTTLAREADTALVLNSPPDELVAIQTYTATLATLALLDAAAADDLDQARRDLISVIAALDALLADCDASSPEWPAFLSGSSPLYLLGRGASLASVHAGVLLMHEAAKLPAVGMSSAQFRHGPVEAVDENFRAIVFGTQPATLAIDAAFADDLVGTGGGVRWIGPAATGSAVTSLCSWPSSIPHRFASILEVVPLQFLAYQMARVRGIEFGKFRFAPTVTLSETGFLATAPRS